MCGRCEPEGLPPLMQNPHQASRPHHGNKRLPPSSPSPPPGEREPWAGSLTWLRTGVFSQPFRMGSTAWLKRENWQGSKVLPALPVVLFTFPWDPARFWGAVLVTPVARVYSLVKEGEWTALWLPSSARWDAQEKRGALSSQSTPILHGWLIKMEVCTSPEVKTHVVTKVFIPGNLFLRKVQQRLSHQMTVKNLTDHFCCKE